MTYGDHGERLWPELIKHRYREAQELATHE